MSSNLLPKKLIILGLVLPLAAFIGFRLADPDFGSLTMLVALGAALCVPVLLKWHHPILIFCWNLPIMAFFLPGSPHLWMLAGFGSLLISVLGAILDKEQRLIRVPAMDVAMIGLVFIVLFTMKATGGGLGLRLLGGETYGAKKYFTILFAVAGYYALSCQRLPLQSANKYLAMLILPGAGTALSNVIYMLGPAFWVLYAAFPVDWALSQAAEDYSLDAASLKVGRLSGFAVAGSAVFSYLIARHGIRGTLDVRKPWRMALLVGVGVVGLFGGFRSILVTYVLLFAVQFFLEGLHRTRLMPAVIGAVLLSFVAIIPIVSKLPLSVQRCFSVLPVDVHPAVRAEALGSTEWRLKMWEILIPEIPKYFWIGKGFTATASDYYLTQQAMRMGFMQGFEGSMIAGDYHNGPLSILIPFGIGGVLAFLLFFWASFHVLVNNYRHGDAAMKHINTFLLGAFITRLILFCFVFGAVQLELAVFIGLVGFSVSLNGGVRRPKPVFAPAPEPVEPVSSFRRTRPVPVRP
jgi:hypothetical protein